MRVAVPVIDQRFSAHFGRSDAVLLAEVNLETGHYEQTRMLARLSTGCDTLPEWLTALGVEHVIVGGIGAGAVAGLAERGIQVSGGFETDDPIDALRQFIADPDRGEPAGCDHHDHEHHHCRHD